MFRDFLVTLPPRINNYQSFKRNEGKVIFHLSYICLSAWRIDGAVTLSEPGFLGSRESCGPLWSPYLDQPYAMAIKQGQCAPWL